ncbi:MAG: ribosomal protein S18-alanine N-acetyltransferase [Gammaproteobacteria bacterium]|nr:ribosomal protein S18-alanine N-acetyltransferase [Gammaproteobacteria bacterium]NNF60812.1 ribosomal protein S18-alanine N-acetyltransferase [Gammaproteobacteria bacterium]NNM21723.1 ribosomal protein S18-alanine N-acetyltransferase [Gammaproteobacteria bacterium]
MTPAVTLRLAVPADAEMIAAMSRKLVEHGLRWTWRPERVARHIERRDTAVLVALDGRRLAGFSIMHFGDDAAHLNLLAVEPSYRNTGVGSRMLKWLEETARVAGVFSVSLEVRVSNRAASSFYRTLGYRETAVLHGYYQGIEDAVRMHRDLSVTVNS